MLSALLIKPPITAGDQELGSIMRLSRESSLKCWDQVVSKDAGMGWSKTAKWVRRRPPRKLTKTDVLMYGTCMPVPLYSVREDTDFDRGVGPTSFKWCLDDEQSSSVHGVGGASGSFHTVFQQARASVDLAMERRISDGEGILRFEMNIPMLQKSIDLTDDEIKQHLEEGEFVCFQVVLGARATGTIKAVGPSRTKRRGTLAASAHGCVNPKHLGAIGGRAHVEGVSESQGPQHFSMECALEGGPMLATNRQGRTASECLNWFETSWKAKVAKSPNQWKVLAVNVHGNDRDLKVAQEAIRREELDQQKQNQEVLAQDRQAQADADLRVIFGRGNVEETSQAVRAHSNSKKSGEELFTEGLLHIAQQKESQLALEQALNQDDIDILLKARLNYQAVTNIDMAADRLLATANLRIAILQELKRAEAKLEKARQHLEDVSSKFPYVDPNVLPAGFTRSASLLQGMYAWVSSQAHQAQKALRMPAMAMGMEGWTKHFDPASGRTYYSNAETGQIVDSQNSVAMLMLATEVPQAPQQPQPAQPGQEQSTSASTPIPRELTHAIFDFENAKKVYDDADMDATYRQKVISETDQKFRILEAKQVYELEIKYNVRGRQTLGGVDEIQFDSKGRRLLQPYPLLDSAVQSASRDLAMLANEASEATASTSPTPEPGAGAALGQQVMTAVSAWFSKRS